MYKNLMVPLDGSHTAEAALATAADVAKRSGATLHLVRVVAWLHELTDMSTARTPRRYLSRVAKDLASSYGIEVQIDLLSDAINGVAYGDPPLRAIAEVLDEYVSSANIDLTVMTSHGRGGFKRLWLGSVADSMMRMCNGSILIIRSHKPVRNRAPILATRILIPVDVDGSDEELVARSVELGEMYGAEYTLIHVAPPALSFVPVGPVAGLAEDVAAIPQTYLERVAATLTETGHRATTVVVTMPFIASEIIAYADEHQYDLVAVSPRGPNWIERAALGSVADKVIRGSQLPVLACNTASGKSRGGAE